MEEFVRQGGAGGMSLSGSLLTCAAELLRMALHYRCRNVFRMRDNHFAPHAVGSLLLLVAALEAWLNEVINSCANMSFSPELRELANAPILDKYRRIPELVGGERLSEDGDLALLIDVRNEIAHFLPRGNVEWEGNVPPAFRRLHEIGLLITTGEPDFDFHFPEKLHSYHLAYWAWEVVDCAVSRFVESLSRIQRLEALAEMISATASNFKMYQRVLPPERLSEFDMRYGLLITRR